MAHPYERLRVIEQIRRDMSKHYEILGLSPKASLDEVKAQYRRLVRLYHPDRVRDTRDRRYAEDRFKEINDAYHELLSEFQRHSGPVAAHVLPEPMFQPAFTRLAISAQSLHTIPLHLYNFGGPAQHFFVTLATPEAWSTLKEGKRLHPLRAFPRTFDLLIDGQQLEPGREYKTTIVANMDGVIAEAQLILNVSAPHDVAVSPAPLVRRQQLPLPSPRYLPRVSPATVGKVSVVTIGVAALVTVIGTFSLPGALPSFFTLLRAPTAQLAASAQLATLVIEPSPALTRISPTMTAPLAGVAASAQPTIDSLPTADAAATRQTPISLRQPAVPVATAMPPTPGSQALTKAVATSALQLAESAAPAQDEKITAAETPSQAAPSQAPTLVEMPSVTPRPTFTKRPTPTNTSRPLPHTATVAPTATATPIAAVALPANTNVLIVVPSDYNVNARATISIRSELVELLPAGSSWPAIGRTTDSLWILLALSGGRQAWVYRESVIANLDQVITLPVVYP